MESTKGSNKLMLMKSISSAFPLVFIACLGCSSRDVAANENCASIPFELVDDMVGPSGKGTAVIAIQTEDLSTTNLACVATRVSETHPSWGDVNVEIFDSAEAARKFSWNQFGDRVASNAASNQMAPEDRWRATYTIDAAKNQQYIVIRAVSRRPEKYETRIDLPITGKARCRFEIGARCVLSVGSPDYPEVVQGPIQGTVTLEADVTPGGTIGSVRIVQVADSTAAGRDLLSRAAIANVKTWRLDPAQRAHRAIIDYRYQFVDGPRKITSEEVVRSIVFGLVEVEMTSGTNLTVKRFTSIDWNR